MKRVGIARRDICRVGLRHVKRVLLGIGQSLVHGLREGLLESLDGVELRMILWVVGL